MAMVGFASDSGLPLSHAQTQCHACRRFGKQACCRGPSGASQLAATDARVRVQIAGRLALLVCVFQLHFECFFGIYMEAVCVTGKQWRSCHGMNRAGLSRHFLQTLILRIRRRANVCSLQDPMQLSAHLHPDDLVQHSGVAFATPGRWAKASTQPSTRTAIHDSGLARHRADWPSLGTPPWRCTYVSIYVQRVRYVPTVPTVPSVHRPVSLHRCQTRGQATITPSIAIPQSRHGRNALRLPASGTIHRGQIPCHYRQLLRAVP